MNTTARDVAAEQVPPCPLLEASRVEGPDSREDPPGPPEPWWLRATDGAPRALWYPRDPVREGTVPAVFVVDPEPSDRSLTLTLLGRRETLSPLETGRLLAYLHDGGDTTENLARNVAPRLGLPASETWVETYRRFLDLPDSMRERLHREDVEPRLVRYLLEVPPRHRRPLVEAVGEGHVDLTVQQARTLSEALRRLPRERDPDWKKHLAPRTDEDPRDAGERWLSEARRLAFPEIHRRERGFREALDDLELDGRIRVDPPPHFEGDYLDFHLRCRRDEDLNHLAEALKSCRPLLEHV